MDHKQKYFKLHRWALIKNFRVEMESQARVRLRIKKRAKQCIKLGRTYAIMKEIFKRFDDHRTAVRKHMAQVSAATRIQQFYRKYRVRQSAGYERRTLKQY